MIGAVIGLITHLLLGSGYLSGGIAMVLMIVLMILLDAVHPPVVPTSLSFALRAGNENNLVLFALAVGMTAVLVVVERFALWLLITSQRALILLLVQRNTHMGDDRGVYFFLDRVLFFNSTHLIQKPLAAA